MADGPRRDVTFDEALAEAAAAALRTPAEPVPLAGLVGRVLAEDVRARADHPGFTNSAMDGYAVRAADAAGGEALALVGESRAGAPFAGGVGPGEAVRISTGAQMPDGADAVLRREDAEERDGRVRAVTPPPAGAHVRRRGEDVRTGQVLLAAGAVVRPHEVAVAAAAGHARVACRRRPRVAVLTSGDEVVPPGSDLGPGQVYDVNGPGIRAQAEAAGAEVVSVERAPDDLRVTIDLLRAALAGHGGRPAPDLLVTVGGVSVGRHDHLRPAFEAVGVVEQMFGVQMRPGHPLWLGRRGAQRVLGLPGNPVSAAVCFHVFGRLLLDRPVAWAPLPLAATHVKQTPRTELVRCRLRDGALVPMPRQGSHAVTSLAGATHLAEIPAGVHEVRAGTAVRCCPLG